MRRIILFATLAILAAGLVVAQENAIVLHWETTAGADRYRVYCGVESRNYTIEQTTPDDSTSYTVAGLPEETMLYCAIKGLNSVGLSQNYSREVVGFPDPEVVDIPVDCDPIEGGGVSCRAYIAGFNFDAEATVEIPYPGVTMGTISRMDSRSIEATFTIAPDALGGSADLIVRNPWTITESTRPPTGDDGSTGGSVVETVLGGVSITPVVLPTTPGNLMRISQ